MLNMKIIKKDKSPNNKNVIRAFLYEPIGIKLFFKIMLFEQLP